MRHGFKACIHFSLLILASGWVAANDDDEILLLELEEEIDLIDSGEILLNDLNPEDELDETLLINDPIDSEPVPTLDDSSPEPTPELANQEAAKVNVISVSENFFKLRPLNSAEGSFERVQTNEARPGDLIELVITANNESDERLTQVSLVNTVPQGPVSFLKETVNFDIERGTYFISRNGDSYFPGNTDIPAEEVNFLQWVINELAPGETLTLSYRIQINE